MVASIRADAHKANAHLFTGDGSPAGVFSIGDAINHIRCAPDGTFWITYFDEGVYSAMEGDAAGDPPVSASGIAHFGSDGRVLWRFNLDRQTAPPIDDCYCCALEDSALWTSYYANFPIVRIDNNKVEVWRNELSGVSAMAIDGNHILLTGGYREKRYRLALVHLIDDRAEVVGELSLKRPERGATCVLQGHGESIHRVENGRWDTVRVVAVNDAIEKGAQPKE